LHGEFFQTLAHGLPAALQETRERMRSRLGG
jgi:hypothetical protein